MGTIKHTGNLNGVSDSPESQFIATVGFTAPFSAATGLLSRNINSPSLYVELTAIGSARDVEEADFFYFRTNADTFMVRLTFDDGSGGDSVQELPLAGELLIQINPDRFLKKAEVKGTGTITYFASTNAE